MGDTVGEAEVGGAVGATVVGEAVGATVVGEAVGATVVGDREALSVARYGASSVADLAESNAPHCTHVRNTPTPHHPLDPASPQRVPPSCEWWPRRP